MEKIVTRRTKAPYSFLTYIILQSIDPEGVLRRSSWKFEEIRSLKTKRERYVNRAARCNGLLIFKINCCKNRTVLQFVLMLYIFQFKYL